MLVEISRVNHAFANAAGGSVKVLSDIDLSIREGELLAIVGPSGCGKTTLLNMMAGLERPDAGRMTIAGQRPRAGDPKVGYVLARDSLLPWRTALGNAELAMEVHGVGRAERASRAQKSLASLGLGAFTDHYPAQLSQGMRQRVALARAFGGEPRVLLMDEPFSALDAQTRLSVQDIFLSEWERHRMTVVLITHDLTEAVGLGDRVVIMTRRPGRIKAIHDVPLPRPRSLVALQGDHRFHEVYEKIWKDLQDEFLGERSLETEPGEPGDGQRVAHAAPPDGRAARGA